MSSYTTGVSTSSVASTGVNSIDSLLDGYKYGGIAGTATTLTYSFPWTTNSTALWADNYGSGENTATTHYGFNETQRLAAISALASWGNVANVTFTEVEESGTEVGDIRFGFSSAVADAGAWGWSYLPTSNPAGGDTWISTDLDSYNLDFSKTGYGYYSLIHELGHSLGFKHPGNYYNGQEPGSYLPAETDNRMYSVMSYNNVDDNWWFDTTTNEWYQVNSQTPMIYDIQAIQYMYGANMTYKTGSDVYTFDDLAPFRMTIWDAGGTDTISVANSSRASLINLNEGSYSSIQTNRVYSENAITDVIDGTYNLGIAYGAIIENATGGSGDDKLIGNQYANTLNGNTGADTMIGGLGNDRYYVDNAGDVVTENAGEGYDVLISTITHTLQNNTEDLYLTGSSNIDGTGNDLKNYLSGNSGDNILNSGIGDDVINGWTGADTMIGGDGNDRYYIDNIGDTATENVGAGHDVLVSSVTYTLQENIENLYLTGSLNIDGNGNTLGNYLSGNIGNNILNGGDGNDNFNSGAGNDTLNGETGDDYLNGGTGADIMLGGLGNDKYYIDNTEDIVTENINEGYDILFSTITYTLQENTEDLYLTGSLNINGTGNDLTNYLAGNSAENILDGAAGNDTINGWAGADTMIGGKGNDRYYIDNAGDIVTEATSNGYDVLISTVTYTMQENTEDLYLAGSSNIDGMGNASRNYLSGNTVNNILDGKEGSDALNGGTGNDTFVFSTTLNSSINKDIIIGFSHLDDSISLDDVIFTQLATGALSSDMFALDAANDANDYILYDSSTGNVSYDSDGNGSGTAVTFATLSNKPSDLSYDDFMVI